MIHIWIYRRTVCRHTDFEMFHTGSRCTSALPMWREDKLREDPLQAFYYILRLNCIDIGAILLVDQLTAPSVTPQNSRSQFRKSTSVLPEAVQLVSLRCWTLLINRTGLTLLARSASASGVH